jgi:two-component system, chemotaxis family, CheB/CheR fusion protein
VAVRINGHTQVINLIVRPLAELAGEHALVMIVFQELGPAVERAAEPASPEQRNDRVVQQLESELRTTKDHLQATVEEVETSNEELKSSNEELLSTNEELQSSNEELQTSKEELQSVNEELETINSELNHKVELLDRANGDLQNLLQSTRIPTVFLDGQLRIKRFTDAATHVFHLIDTDVGRPITDITGRFEGAIEPDMKEVLATLAVRERTVRLADQSASYLLRILPYRRVDNVIDGLVVTFLDVSAIEEAQQQRARLAAIVESSHDAIVGRTLTGGILSWNQAAATLLGYEASEVLDQPLARIVPPDRQPDLDQAFERLEGGELLPPFASTLVRKDGQRVEVSVGLSPIKESDGRMVGASAIFRDITELKLAQAALAAEEGLKAEARHKDEFLALLSHELRNPLAPIRSCLDVIRQPNSTTEQVERCLEVMDRQLVHMAALVDQLMDASRIASGKIKVELRDEDLVEVVRAAVEDQRRVVESARLHLDLRLPGRPLWIRGDSLRLSQVVANLIGNAAKFTDPDGTVTITVASDARNATVTVRDTGAGLEPAEITQLFRPFTQPESGSRRPRGGLGLGLALVRGLVHAHGGTVEAMSEGPGRGSTFVVTLPLEDWVLRRPSGAASRPVARTTAPRRVLIIEDNLDAAEGLHTLLGLFGHRVEVAHEGVTGLALAQSFRPEVVLCDLGLPGMSGYEIASAMRASEDLRSTYLVALTGFDQASDQQRTREAGFNRHITKPVDVPTLRQLLEDVPAR